MLTFVGAIGFIFIQVIQFTLVCELAAIQEHGISHIGGPKFFFSHGFAMSRCIYAQVDHLSVELRKARMLAAARFCRGLGFLKIIDDHIL